MRSKVEAGMVLVLVILLHLAGSGPASGAGPWVSFGPPTNLSPNRGNLYGTKDFKKTLYHTGLDYSGNGNVMATADGVVVRVETMSRGDHGMGNNVIIKHTLSNGSAIYSTYSHMGSIDPGIRPNVKVTRGRRLGTIGGSGYGNPRYWPNHLHLEMKLSPVTGSPKGGSYWGYTPKHPDSYGYVNPANYIGK